MRRARYPHSYTRDKENRGAGGEGEEGGVEYEKRGGGRGGKRRVSEEGGD